MLDGHPKDVQEITLRQRSDNEVRFKDHSRSRRDTTADTTQITRDTNVLSRLSAQLNPLNITITELKKGNCQPPNHQQQSLFLPTPSDLHFEIQDLSPNLVHSYHYHTTHLIHRVLFGRQTKHQQHNTIHRQIEKANMSNRCQAVEELMDKYRDDIHTPEFLPVDQRMQQSCQKMTR